MLLDYDALILIFNMSIIVTAQIFTFTLFRFNELIKLKLLN